ncbi:MAG: exodeoxyribonuclease III [Desulfobacteraceae bacterium]|nr:exodeoxyribonuclease III [Desulfobacteraceae bacterium]
MSWKIATFNVNGIRSRLDVVVSWLDRVKPDVLCLQEIKCRDPEFPVGALSEIGYESSVCGQKSFHGVAIVSRVSPDEVRRGFNDGQSDEEARLIAARIDGIWVFNTYVPQGRSPEHAAFQDKLLFFRRLGALFEREFTPDDPLIWAGDINVAPEDMDVFSAKRMAGKVGVHPLEREALGEVCSWGFADLFRKHHPTEKQFTFWDYRLPESFRRNLGWRLDHIRATKRVAAASVACEADMELRGANTPSDHVPVWAEIDLEKL